MNKNAFNDRFSQYLKEKLGDSKRKEIFGQQFEGSSVKKEQQLEESNTILLTPNSNHSFDSSSFSSRFKASSSRSVENSQPKKLRKLRELEENECAICLCQISNKAHLSCKHNFCHCCLEEWLKNSSKCPYCRSEVTSYWLKGEQYLVQSKEFEYEGEEDENLDWVCYQCDHTEPGDIVLICDRCQANACHINCDPALRGRQPLGDWYCHFCR